MNHVKPRRCGWVGDDPMMITYHDTEWGVPTHDDLALFTALLVDGAQAGLSWETILHKRENYRKAFAGFDPAKIAKFTALDRRRLMRDRGIVRNALKIKSAIKNAQAVVDIKKTHGSFDAFIWKFVGGKPITHSYVRMSQIPVFSRESIAMSKELKKLGCTFVGPTICYAFMQGVGMVNDHVVSCVARKGPYKGLNRAVK